MNRYVTKGIVLSRIDYGEADRIITFITPERGKLRAMAKGVRKPKSKIAGGIELFSISDLTILQGKGEINTLMSARLDTHFGHIVKDTARTHAAYEAIKAINKATEEEPEEAYFNLLAQTYESLNDSKLNPDVTAAWFAIRLLHLAGHTPDLSSDLNGDKLAQADNYDFNLDAMRFTPSPSGHGAFAVNDIKFLRLGARAASAGALQQITDAPSLAANLHPLLQSMLKTSLGLK